MQRRRFLKASGLVAAGALVKSRSVVSQAMGAPETGFHIVSDSMDLVLSEHAPEFLSLNIDGLGKGMRGANIIGSRPGDGGYVATPSGSGSTQQVAYRIALAAPDSTPCWTFDFSPGRIVLTSEWSPEFQPPAMMFRFDLNKVHSTVLGRFEPGDLLAMPALMHFPGQGSVRITANVSGPGLTYVSDRRASTASLSLPGADIRRQRIVYTLEVTAIHPEVPGTKNDPRFDAFRRNWLNALQLNPSLQALANNTASDSCAFCYYEFADIAALTPPLAPGLTALDVMRQTLDRMLAGAFAYGAAVVPDHPSASGDFYPAMIIAAAQCARADNGGAWLKANYDGIRAWVDTMLATDTDGNGLVKYGLSGNSGIWTNGFPKLRPSNWWDTIGFGHEDAYANALAYRALDDAARMAKSMGKPADAARYTAARTKIREVYYKTFFNPATGILGGWRSSDGELHDYWFLWVNGIAIHYGLVPKREANQIMDKLLAKMREVGYDKFNMGLPGNLITVPLKDYVHRVLNVGGGVRPDNADGFQNYENGGATGSFAFFTLAALYDLGRRDEADKIFFPMLAEYGRSGFEGRGKDNRSNDWRRWDGTPMGYEGYLTDNYYTMRVVPLRADEIAWTAGYRPDE
jgi:hypothetical protein